jgi:hypothetical protein
MHNFHFQFLGGGGGYEVQMAKFNKSQDMQYCTTCISPDAFGKKLRKMEDE